MLFAALTCLRVQTQPTCWLTPSSCWPQTSTVLRWDWFQPLYIFMWLINLWDGYQKWLHIWYAAACTCNTCLKLILSWEKLTCKDAWTLNPENLFKSLMKGMNIIWYVYTKLQKFVSELSAWYYFPYYRWCTRWQRSNILRWIGALMIARTCQGNTCLLSMMRSQGTKSRWRL